MFIIRRLIFNLGYFIAFVKDIPYLIQWKYYELKYGGQDNVPQHLKDEDLQRRARLSVPDEKTLKFAITVTELHKKFHIPIAKSNASAMIFGYYTGDLKVKFDPDAIMASQTYRRELFNFMVETKDITEHKLNYFFPPGEHREALEAWLDGSTEK